MTAHVSSLECDKGPNRHGSSRLCWGLVPWAHISDPNSAAVVRAGSLILTWYLLSTALNIYNKALVGKQRGVFGPGHPFPAPLLLASIQFAFQTLLAKATFAVGLVARSGGLRTWHDWTRLVLPNGIITGMDIGFSNKSLVYITMSFYTMCKSTTPIFLLLFAFLWGLERPSWRLAGVVSIISSGLLLLVAGETHFQLTGFLLVMSASCFAGLRFTITQVLLHGRPQLQGQAGTGSNGGAAAAAEEQRGATPSGGGSGGHGGHAPLGGALEVLELLTPVMSATCLLLSLGWEQLWVALPASPYFSSLPHLGITLLIIWVGAVMAFLMVWTEYQVIKETSALTFMIAATFKEMLTVMAGVMVFGDTFGPINGVGLVVLLIGAMMFNWYKMDRVKTAAAEAVRAGGRSSSSSDEGGTVLGTGEGSFLTSMSPRAPANVQRRVSRAWSIPWQGEGQPRPGGSSNGGGLEAGGGPGLAGVGELDEEDHLQQLEQAPLLRR